MCAFLLMEGAGGAWAAPVAVEEGNGSMLPPPWKEGETLTYRVRWGMVPAAEARFTATHPEAGRWRFELELHSLGALETLHPIRDTAYSIVDAAPWRSIEYGENRSEGKHRVHRVTRIDGAKETGLLSDLIEGAETPFAIPALSLDELNDLGSMLYALRRIDWKPGVTHELLVYDDAKMHRGEATFVRQENVVMNGSKTPIPCFVIELRPVYTDPAQTAHHYGVTLWIRNDATRIPVRADLKARFGTVTLDWIAALKERESVGKASI